MVDLVGLSCISRAVFRISKEPNLNVHAHNRPAALHTPDGFPKKMRRAREKPREDSARDRDRSTTRKLTV